MFFYIICFACAWMICVSFFSNVLPGDYVCIFLFKVLPIILAVILMGFGMTELGYVTIN
jgi:hypothetical protein